MVQADFFSPYGGDEPAFCVTARAANVAEADEAEERNSKASQEARILEHFKKGGTLTHIEAEIKFGCARLAARVNALRKRKHPIQSRMVETSSGKRVAEYSMGGGDE